MKDPALPAEGGCRCGRLRFRVTAPPLVTSACHCRGCQRMSGAPYSTTAIMPAAAFEVTGGDPVRGGLKGDQALHHHCPDCMSWVFTRIAGLEDQVVNVRATMFDDPGWFAPYMETCTTERLSFAETGAERAFDQFPDMPEFMTLMADYAAAIGREG